MWFFSKRVKPKAVLKHLNAVIPTWDMGGFPKLAERNAKTFIIRTWSCFARGKNCNYALESRYKGRNTVYTFWYDGASKKIKAEMYILNVPITNEKLQAGIEAAFNGYSVYFGAKEGVTVSKWSGVCEKLEDVQQFLEEWRRDLTKREAFEFFCQFKTTEEIRMGK